MRINVVLTYLPLCVCCAFCSLPPARAGEIRELSSEAYLLVEELQLERERLGVPRLEHDEIQSHVIERRLPAIVAGLPPVLPDSVIKINLDEHIYDWHKVCFAAAGPSFAEVAKKLLADDAFMGALEAREYTHLVVAYSDSVPPSVTIVVLVQRFVQFGICTSDLTDMGYHSTTLNGHAPGADSLRFVLYKGTERPGEYVGTETSTQTIGLEEDGEFSVDILLSRFGFGKYRLSVYVKLRGGDEYILSSWLPFTVNPPNISYPPRVSPYRPEARRP